MPVRRIKSTRTNNANIKYDNNPEKNTKQSKSTKKGPNRNM